ncbi:endonuclease domain-containing protein [Arenibacter sp. F20364]|nr:endonuclease domain-containing protein [Arenibacter sp. F20364]
MDFYCKELQLAIEVDGSVHFLEGHPEKDTIRQNRLEYLGIYFI